MGGWLSTVAFTPEKQIPDLSGKVILITGANGGLGYESLIHIAPHNPSKIYLCARSKEKYETAMKGINERIPGHTDSIKYLELDLTSLASVKKAAEMFLAENERLDILMNNAGIMASPPGLTKEGYEIQFGTNHVGHFLLTKELMPILKKTAASSADPVRIINVSSEGHKLARGKGFNPDQVVTDMKDYSTWTRYGQSKLANILFTTELHRREPEITSIVIHPGGVTTNLTQTIKADHPWFFAVGNPVFQLLGTQPAQGAYNQTWAATAPVKGKKGSKVEGTTEVEGGKYYVPVTKMSPGTAFARNSELAGQLWKWSEEQMEKHGY